MKYVKKLNSKKYEEVLTTIGPNERHIYEGPRDYDSLLEFLGNLIEYNHLRLVIDEGEDKSKSRFFIQDIPNRELYKYTLDRLYKNLEYNWNSDAAKRRREIFFRRFEPLEVLDMNSTSSFFVGRTLKDGVRDGFQCVGNHPIPAGCVVGVWQQGGLKHKKVWCKDCARTCDKEYLEKYECGTACAAMHITAALRSTNSGFQ